MSNDLIERLRTCSNEERKAVAIELAKTRTHEAAVELMRMVDGRHRNGSGWYSLRDQLIGIEALGETGLEDVRDTLKMWYTPVVQKDRANYGWYGGCLSALDVTQRTYDYPNFNRGLRNALEYSHALAVWDGMAKNSGASESDLKEHGGYSGFVELDGNGNFLRGFNEKAHRTIIAALRKLGVEEIPEHFMLKRLEGQGNGGNSYEA
jgi:hypothetical protein